MTYNAATILLMHDICMGTNDCSFKATIDIAEKVWPKAMAKDIFRQYGEEFDAHTANVIASMKRLALI